MAELHLAILVSGCWCCACWLAHTERYFIMLQLTCFTYLDIQNVSCEKGLFSRQRMGNKMYVN